MSMTDDERWALVRQTQDELIATTRAINRELSEPMWRQMAKAGLVIVCAAAFLTALSAGMKIVSDYLGH